MTNINYRLSPNTNESAVIRAGDLMRFQHGVGMNAAMNVREQLIICPFEIGLRLSNWRSPLEDNIHVGSNQPVDRHPKAVPLTLNIFIKMVRNVKQLIGIGSAVRETIDFIGRREIRGFRFNSRISKDRLNKVKNERVVSIL